jgi:hypothetical protein
MFACVINLMEKVSIPVGVPSPPVSEYCARLVRKNSYAFAGPSRDLHAGQFVFPLPLWCFPTLLFVVVS